MGGKFVLLEILRYALAPAQDFQGIIPANSTPLPFINLLDSALRFCIMRVRYKENSIERVCFCAETAVIMLRKSSLSVARDEFVGFSVC